MTAGVAVRAGEATGEDPALEIAAQLAFDVARDRHTVGIGFAPDGEPGLEVLLDQSVERGALGAATTVDRRRAGTSRGTDVRGDGRHPCRDRSTRSAEGSSRPKCRRIGALILVAACTDASDDSETAAQQNAGSVCTRDLYDGCTSDDQCSSGTCKLYSNRGVQVCTQTCDAANPYPSQDGKAVVCNKKGIRRPDAPNACQVE